MIDIFIQFGDEEGEAVGLSLRSYLFDRALFPFLAGKKSKDIPAGVTDYWTFIREKIKLADVMVSICSEGFDDSIGVQKEFEIIEEERGKDLPQIPFIKKGCTIPKYFQNAWHPLYFDVESCEENFCELLNEIYRWAYFKNIEAVAQLGQRIKVGNRRIYMR